MALIFYSPVFKCCRYPSPLQESSSCSSPAGGIDGPFGKRVTVGFFFFSLNSWPLKKKKKSRNSCISTSVGLEAVAHRRKENALHSNNEGEAASAVRPTKGFTELCFRGPLRHIGDTSLLVKEIIIGQKLPINSFRNCKCCQLPLCCLGSLGC